jgi:hypothetical protein
MMNEKPIEQSTWTDGAEDVLDGASDALVRRLAALTYAGGELTALLLGTLGPGSRRYLHRIGALASEPDPFGRPQLTDFGRELCKRATVRVIDRDVRERAEQARGALCEAVERAERMTRASGSTLKF